ncbi:MAG: RDD family protein [Arenicella sp.]
MQIDTLHSVETPEGVDLHVDVSGIVVRFIAFGIDFLIRGFVLVVAMWVFVYFGILGDGTANALTGVYFILFFILEWFYPVLFEVLRNGQTPGKKWMKIKVINEDLTPVTWGASITRNLLRSVDFLPFVYCFGMLSMILSNKFQRLGDLAAATLVVYVDKQEVVNELPRQSPQPLWRPLNQAGQQALIAYTHRHNALSAARKIELANILAAETGKEDQACVDYLQAVGVGLLGAK